MKSFVVMFHEEPAVLVNMSPSQMQSVVARYSAWFTRLREAGRIQMSAKLRDEGGKHLRRNQQRVLASDGPFVEAKDVVSGLFILHADNYEDAQKELADCPHFDFGWTEVREIEFVK
ncbi:MAG TPA: YciI family protein [Povalibacter sp.]|nr:YciI family protein [Povalibacter sp.]